MSVLLGLRKKAKNDYLIKGGSPILLSSHQQPDDDIHDEHERQCNYEGIGVHPFPPCCYMSFDGQISERTHSSCFGFFAWQTFLPWNIRRCDR